MTTDRQPGIAGSCNCRYGHGMLELLMGEFALTGVDLRRGPDGKPTFFIARNVH